MPRSEPEDCGASVVSPREVKGLIRNTPTIGHPHMALIRTSGGPRNVRRVRTLAGRLSGPSEAAANARFTSLRGIGVCIGGVCRIHTYDAPTRTRQTFLVAVVGLLSWGLGFFVRCFVSTPTRSRVGGYFRPGRACLDAWSPRFSFQLPEDVRLTCSRPDERWSNRFRARIGYRHKARRVWSQTRRGHHK